MKTNTYEKGTAILKPTKDKNDQMVFNWNYTGQRKPKNLDSEKVDSFVITVQYKGKETDFEFFNSIMETEITNKINNLGFNCGFNWKETLRLLTPKMWGGYDGLKNSVEFKQKRIYYLVYGFVISYCNGITTEIAGFKWFCDCFGYDTDSRRAETIYKQLEEEVSTAQSMGLFEHRAFIESIAQEEEGTDEFLKQCGLELNEQVKE